MPECKFLRLGVFAIFTNVFRQGYEIVTRPSEQFPKLNYRLIANCDSEAVNGIFRIESAKFGIIEKENDFEKSTFLA